MKIKCYFCNKELDSRKLSSTMIQCVCDECPEICSTTYGFSSLSDDVTLWAASITFGDSGKDYQAMYYHPDLFYIDELRYSNVDNKLHPRVRVMQLSFCPKNITPHNIRQKFLTLKVWS